MITLQKIYLKNFLSHANTKLTFEDEHQLLIDGKSGSGKSSIIEAIIWTLYGKGRSHNRSLIKHGSKSAEISLYLKDIKEDEIYEYLLERSITRSGKHNFSVLQKEGDKYKPIPSVGVKETQSYLEKEILRSSYLLFINSIAYPQDNIENFVQQSAGKRKDIILEMIKAEDYDVYYNTTKEKLNEYTDKLNDIEGRITTLQQSAEQDKQHTKSLADLTKQKESIKKQVLDIENKLSKNREEQNSQREIKTTVENTEKLITEKENEAIKINEEVDELSEKINNYDADQLKREISELEPLKKDLEQKRSQQQEYMVWQQKRNELIQNAPIKHDFSAEIKMLNKKIMEVMDNKIPTCHKCGTPYQEYEERKQKEIEKLNSELAERKQAENDYQQFIDEYKNKISQLGEKESIDHAVITKLEQKIDNAQQKKELFTSFENTKQNLKQKEELQQKISSEINKLTSEKERLQKQLYLDELIKKQNKLLSEKNSLEEQQETVVSQHAIAEEAKQRLEKTEKEIKNAEKERKELREDQENLSLLKDAFSQNGVKAILIDYMIPQLEDKVNNILNQMSDFRVQFDTQRTGMSKDTTLEGLFINIYNERGEEFDFDNYSGGERLKIVVAISEALSEIQRIGFRILDELFVGLDEESTQQFADVMNSLQKRFDQLICISHLRNIKDMFTQKITITKQNGISSIMN